MEPVKTQWEVNYEKRQALINGYAQRCYQPMLREVGKILVYHPEEHRRYLQQHPCQGCGAQSFCDIPCPVYLKWYNARIEAARVRGRGKIRYEIRDMRYEIQDPPT